MEQKTGKISAGMKPPMQPPFPTSPASQVQLFTYTIEWLIDLISAATVNVLWY